MNRFIIQVSFQTESELNEAKKKLLEIGVEKDNIEHIKAPVKKKSVFKAKVFTAYAAIGSLIYFTFLFIMSERGIENAINEFSFLYLLLTSLFVSFFSFPVRYILSKFKVTNELETESPAIAVVTPYEKVSIIKRNLEEFETDNIEIIDDHADVEAGLRV